VASLYAPDATRLLSVARPLYNLAPASSFIATAIFPLDPPFLSPALQPAFSFPFQTMSTRSRAASIESRDGSEGWTELVIRERIPGKADSATSDIAKETWMVPSCVTSNLDVDPLCVSTTKTSTSHSTGNNGNAGELPNSHAIRPVGDGTDTQTINLLALLTTRRMRALRDHRSAGRLAAGLRNLLPRLGWPWPYLGQMARGEV
jgi:hypothetical protein